MLRENKWLTADSSQLTVTQLQLALRLPSLNVLHVDAAAIGQVIAIETRGLRRNTFQRASLALRRSTFNDPHICSLLTIQRGR